MAWDMSSVMSRAAKKAESEQRAVRLYAMLMALKPANLTERQWTKKAGVSGSFFTNLKGGSEPSIGLLRQVLNAVGVSLPEFFVQEAEGRLVQAPNEQELAAAIERVLPGLPLAADKRAEFLASTVSGVLRLPASMRTRIANDDSAESADPVEAAPTRAATK